MSSQRHWSLKFKVKARKGDRKGDRRGRLMKNGLQMVCGRKKYIIDQSEIDTIRLPLSGSEFGHLQSLEILSDVTYWSIFIKI